MQRNVARSERLAAFSDGVIAVIITIMVLELKPPEHPTFAALCTLWPTMLSYLLSYIFVAVIWINHHHLLRFAERATIRLIWSNFAFLFTVSLVPFTTAWLADTRLGAVPVATYSAVFMLVNFAYLFFEGEALRQARGDGAVKGPHLVHMTRLRSMLTLGGFTLSLLIALRHPTAAFAILCLCVLSYLSPGSLACVDE
jgi:uncharacterized membrane protein